MKKLFLAVTLIVTIATAAFGAVSEDMSVYVRQDVFEARMEALSAQIQLGNEKIISEIRVLATKLEATNARIDEVNIRINDNQAATSARIDDLKTIIYWGISILGLILGFAIFAPALGEFLRNFHKPQITLDDIRRLIEEHDIQLGRMSNIAQ